MSSGKRQLENSSLYLACAHICRSKSTAKSTTTGQQAYSYKTSVVMSLFPGLTESLSVVSTLEGEALSRAVDAHTITQITQIWADRLRLTSISVSQQLREGKQVSDSAHAYRPVSLHSSTICCSVWLQTITTDVRRVNWCFHH